MLKLRAIGDPHASRLSHLLTELAKKISNSLGDSGEQETGVPGLYAVGESACTGEPDSRQRASVSKRTRLANT